MKCPIKKLEAECIKEECPFFKDCECLLRRTVFATQKISFLLNKISKNLSKTDEVN